MQDSPLETRRGSLWLTTDRRRLDPTAALALLRTTYWGDSLTLEVLTRAIEHSVCFGVFDAHTLIGFGRVITDLATYAYWTDVVVAEAHRGRGIGRWLSETMLAHPQLQGFRRVSLLTRDAVSLYERLGFRPTAGALTYMEHRDPGVKNRILRALSIGLLALAGPAAAQRITPQFASGGAPPAALVVPRRPSAPALLVPQPRVPSTHWEVSP